MAQWAPRFWLWSADRHETLAPALSAREGGGIAKKTLEKIPKGILTKGLAIALGSAKAPEWPLAVGLGFLLNADIDDRGGEFVRQGHENAEAVVNCSGRG